MVSPYKCKHCLIPNSNGARRQQQRHGPGGKEMVPLTRARVYLRTPEMRVHPMITPPGASRAPELERASRVLVLLSLLLKCIQRAVSVYGNNNNIQP